MTNFVTLAIPDSNLPDGNYPLDLASARLCGAIGQRVTDGSCAAFIKAGLDFLDGFPASAENEIYSLEESDGDNAAVIDAIHGLVKEAADVDRGEFAVALARQWDEDRAA